MTDPKSIEKLKDNPAITGREDKFVTMDVKVAPILASWRESIFAHEWLTSDGLIRPLTDMSEPLRAKRLAVEKLIQDGRVLDRPVLGIGILDNIEIGSAKDVFLVLAGQGATSVSVHIPKSQIKDFRIFLR